MNKLRIFRDYNPFYLLSALCMLAGLLALGNSLDFSPLPLRNLLWLIFVLNVYELLIIGVGGFLIRRGLLRDAAMLFVIESFFLVDAGFLNSEMFTLNFQVGLGVNAALFILAAVKVAMVFRALKLPLSDNRYPLILSQMLLLLAIPGFFKQMAVSHNGSLPPPAMFGMWWIVGLVPIVSVLLLRNSMQTQHRKIVAAFVLMPVVSIIAHLGTSNWVYHIDWQEANLSPVLLGLAVAIGMSDQHVRSLTARMRLQLILPVLAILLAVQNSPELNFAVAGHLITPLRLALLGATLVYLHGLLIHRHPYFAGGAVTCLAAAGLGHNPQGMSENFLALLENSYNRMVKMIPQTLQQWGVASVVTAFLLLGIGVMTSLFKRDERA